MDKFEWKIYTNELIGSYDQTGRHADIWYKPFKMFFSQTGKPMTLKLGMNNCVSEYFQDC